MVEHLSIVNEKDEEIGKATYAEAAAKKLTRRIVHVLVFNNEGKMLVQKRSMLKTFCPGTWSTAVGGHVNFGEDYLEAAKREMMEEIGIAGKLQFLKKHNYVGPDGTRMFLSVYKTISNGPFQVDSKEADSVNFFSLDEIGKMVEQGDQFHPELLFLFKNLYS